MEAWISFASKTSGIGVVLNNANGGNKMNKQKVDSVVEQLMRAGFDMTTDKLFRTTVNRIFRKYGISEKLTADEYPELIRQLLDICAENDLREMGFGCINRDELMDK